MIERNETMNDRTQPTAPTRDAAADAATGKSLSEPAKRALAEAEDRRRAYREAEAAMPKEVGGRGGKEPVRYGDWEIKGLASDF